jgi:hypothetical protein
MIMSKADLLMTTDHFASVRFAIQRLGQAVALLMPFIVIYNEYAALTAMDPYYRITLPALCFFFALVTTSYSLKLGIAGCIFALPLIPNLAVQILGFLGYARVAHLHNPGLELIAGLYFGVIINRLLHRKQSSLHLDLPWQAGLVMLFVTVSVLISIAKNLHQSASDFHLSALLFNLMHLRSIDWHDDYRPLVDWISYGSAFALLAIFVPALKSMPNRNHLVFKPLLWGIIIAAIVGYWQSKIGIGLTKDQLMFRADVLGYMAVGFQPDNHAFAGHMLLGTIGLIGYLYFTDSKPYHFWILALAMPLAWVSLLLSKSRSSFALSIVFLAIILLVWVFRHSRYLSKTALTVCALLVATFFSFIAFKNDWLTIFTLVAHKLGFADLSALNLALVYRPEIFAAAIKIFSLFPILGLGQGEFYRQAASHELTNSYYLSIEQNGENAHNYFLQTLAETGLLGFLLFTFFVLYPIWKIKNKKVLVPAIVAITAVFVGNLYSHSMLVRENLFLATTFIALMYAWLEAENNSIPNSQRARSSTTTSAYPALLITCIILSFAVNETYRSFNNFPFTEDFQCYKNKTANKDGWTSGLVQLPLPADSIGLSFKIIDMQPANIKTPLKATLSLLSKDNKTLITKELSLTRDKQDTFEIRLPENLAVNSVNDYQAVLRLNHCFIPRNLGNNPDGRRLGVKLGPINYLHK